MQYTILINQLQAVRISEQTKIELDVADMAIFQFIVDFANSPNCKRDDEWFWITTKKIIAELPLIGLKWRQIHNRLNKLVAAKLLIRNPRNEQQSISLFKFGENYDGYLFDSTVAENYNPPLQNFATPVAENYNPPLQKNATNHITNISSNHLSNNHSIDNFREVVRDFPENHAADGGGSPKKNENSDGTYWDDGTQTPAAESGKEKKGSAEKKEKKPDIDFAAIAEQFNRIMDENGAVVPRVTRITDRRKTMLASRLKEYPNTDFEQLFTRIAKSDFLNGGGPSGWVMDFDWLIRPNNYPKVIEGNYDNGRHPKKNGQTDVRRFAGEQQTAKRDLNW